MKTNRQFSQGVDISQVTRWQLYSEKSQTTFRFVALGNKPISKKKVCYLEEEESHKYNTIINIKSYCKINRVEQSQNT